MKNLIKYIPITLAGALISMASYADTHFFSVGTANEFSIDFVDIGYAGNTGTTIDYQITPDFSPGWDSPNDFGVPGYDAPSTAYGAVGYEYGIGKYEVTIDQFTKANAASGGQIGNGDENVWNSGLGDWNNDPLLVGTNAPATQLKWNEAARFANWLSSGDVNVGAYTFSENTVSINRSYRNEDDLAFVLPSEDEWYKAAYYMPVDDGSYSLYSSGLNSSPIVGTTNGWNYNPAHQLQHMWEAGSGAEEQNGTYDMMGNAWEWTETAGSANTNYVVRGASAYAPEQYLDSQTYRLISAAEEENIGLRIVAIPEPNTIVIIVLAAVGMVGVRRFFIL